MSGKEKTNGSLAMAPRVITIPAANQEAARKLAHQGAEVIVLDCMGYSKTLRDICAEAVDVPVIASSTMVAELTANLL